MNRTLFSASIRLDADRFVRPLRTAKTEMAAFSAASTRASARHGAFARTTAAQSTFMGRAVSRSMALGRAATGQFERGLGFLERRVRSLARTLKMSVLFGGFGLSAMFTGGVAAGLKFNATFEDATRSFEVFLGTEKKAKRFIETLRTVSKSSPFRLTDFMGNARQLLGAGMDAERIPRLLTATGNAVAAMGGGQGEMEQVVRALGQIQAKGKVSAEELIQLSEAGVPVQKILQRQLKLTGEEVGNIGNQGISAQRGLDAITKGLEAQFAGAGVKFRQTYTGKIAVLKKDIERLLRVSTASLFTTIRDDALPVMTRVVGRITDIFEGSGSFGTKIDKTWDYLTTSFNKWLDAGGLKSIEQGASRMGEVIAGGVNAVFGVGGDDGKKSPFYRAGSGAIRAFAKGFTNELKTGDILTSPLGRVLEGYFLLKFGPRLLRKLTGGVGGGIPGAATSALGQRVYWGPAPLPVVVMGGGGVPGAPGKPTPGGPMPVPSTKTTPGGSGRKIPWARVKKLAGRWGPAAALVVLEEYLRTGRFPDPLGVVTPVDPAGGPAALSARENRINNRKMLQARMAGLKAMADEGRLTFEQYIAKKQALRANVREANAAGTDAIVNGVETYGPGTRNDRTWRPTYTPASRLPAGFLSPEQRAQRQREFQERRDRTATGAAVAAGNAAAFFDTGGKDRGIGPGIFGPSQTNETEKSLKRTLAAANDLLGRNVPVIRKLATDQGTALAQGLSATAVLQNVRNSVGAIIAAAKTTLSASSSPVQSLTGLPGTPGLPSWLGGGATGDAPSPSAGSSTFFGVGQAMGAQFGSALSAGVGAGVGAATAAPTLPSAGTGGMPGGVGGNWGGSMPLALGLAQLSGLPITSQKRGTKHTASGGVSDHWTGNTSAFAVDLATTPPAGDAVAQRLGAAIGAPDYTGGSWLNRTINGFRYQLGWRTPGHFDHIHLGVRKMHGGGIFNAPTQGGEGLAVLRDRERVVPASGAGARAATRPVAVNVTGNTFNVRSEGDIDSIAHALGEHVQTALDNMTLVSAWED